MGVDGAVTVINRNHHGASGESKYFMHMIPNQLTQRDYRIVVLLEMLQVGGEDRSGQGHTISNDWTETMIDENRDVEAVLPYSFPDRRNRGKGERRDNTQDFLRTRDGQSGL